MHTFLTRIAFLAVAVPVACGDGSGGTATTGPAGASAGGAAGASNGGTGAGASSSGGTGTGTGTGGTGTGGTSTGSTDQDPSPTLTSAQMQEALDFVSSTLMDVNVQTVDGAPPAFASALELAREEIRTPMTEAEFYFVLSRLLVSLNDAHTRIEFSEASLAGENFIDLPLFWSTEAPYVTRDANGLKKGDRIVSVGGKTTEVILRELRTLIPHENIYFVRGAAPVQLVRREFLHELDLVSPDGTVAVEVSRDGEPVTAHFSMDSARPHFGPVRNWVGYSFDDESPLGLFWLDTCVYDDEYKETLAAFMQEVADRSIKDIAVDLSYNQGGDVTVAFALMAYLDRDYDSFGIIQRTSDVLFEQLPIFASDDWKGALEAFGIEYSAPLWNEPPALVKLAVEGQLPPVDPALKYDGRIHGFVSAREFSSANLFSTLLMDNDTGLILGEASGNEIHFHGGQTFLDIPQTSYRLSSSSTRNLRPKLELGNENAIYPGVPVRTGRDDVINERLFCPDCPQMDVLINIIAERDEPGSSL